MLPVYSYFRYATSILCALGGFLIVGFVFPSTKFYYQHSPYARLTLLMRQNLQLKMSIVIFFLLAIHRSSLV
jgi:hypothetical protein